MEMTKQSDQNRSPGAPDISGDKRFLAVVATVYLVFWIILAIEPVSRVDWFLENILVFLGCGAIAFTYRRFPLARASYLLIAIFLALHAIGAHYTYSLTPLGDQIKALLGQERNHYDRLVHFSFGLLWVYPFHDLLGRYVVTGHRLWRGTLAISLILALSGLYELIEWGAAMILEPETALAFLGTQGDVFDGQKDAGLAFVGGLLGLLILAAVKRRGRPRA